MGDGGWMTAEFRVNKGLARLLLEDPYHAVEYRAHAALHRVTNDRGNALSQPGISRFGRGFA
eukprot:3405601-Alexandrium_andersonii.AAC.1